MKKLLSLFLLMSQFAVTQTPGARDGRAAPALTAEEILEKYVAAIGGRERISKVKTIVEKASIQSRKDVSTYVLYRKAPDKFKRVNENSKHAKTGGGFDGQTHWMLPAEGDWGGRVFLLGNQPFPYGSIASKFLIRPYKEARLRGTKKVNDKQAYVVELRQEGGDRWTYYLDVDTSLVLRIDSETRPTLLIVVPGSKGAEFPSSPLADTRMTSTSYYSDWREVDGVKLPFEIKQKEGVTKILDCQIDADIDDSVFAPLPGSTIIQAPKKKTSN